MRKLKKRVESSARLQHSDKNEDSVKVLPFKNHSGILIHKEKKEEKPESTRLKSARIPAN